MRLLEHNGATLGKIGRFIFYQTKRYGFTMTDDEGLNWVVCHRKRIEKLSKELGFYIPAPLCFYNHIFEIGPASKCIHYLYRSKSGNRIINTDPHVFVGLTKLEWIQDAQHIPRPRSHRG